MRDHCPGASHRSWPQGHWRDQQGIRAGGGIVADNCPALELGFTAVVAGDRASPNVDALAKLSVSGVTEMMDLCVPSHASVFELDVIAESGAVLDVSIRPEVRERSDLDFVLYYG